MNPHKSSEVGMYYPHVIDGKQRHRKVRWLTHSYTVNLWQSQDYCLGVPAFQPHAHSMRPYWLTALVKPIFRKTPAISIMAEALSKIQCHLKPKQLSFFQVSMVFLIFCKTFYHYPSTLNCIFWCGEELEYIHFLIRLKVFFPHLNYCHHRGLLNQFNT